MDLSKHPCFNDKARHTFGRVHLPVAPRCNIQCKFCNRKFDCVNESRPGVTSGILSPVQAMAYLEQVMKQKKNISVVGIAGPGDPFANPGQTIETLRLVRAAYPDMLLCVATNGLNVGPYVEDMKRLAVSHVTITVNAVDPAVGEKIYSWIRYGKRVLKSEKGASILLENQLAGIKALKAAGVTVKVNSIIIPGINAGINAGINDTHIEAVAKKMSELNVDILNCVPYYPNSGSAFSHIGEPSKKLIAEIRKAAGLYISQMNHCTRCRADAVGMLGETACGDLMAELKRCADLPEVPAVGARNPDRHYVAVASMEGMLVNQHLGEASHLHIYRLKNGSVSRIESRETPRPGGGFKRWEKIAGMLGDCSALLVSGIGDVPRQALTEEGIEVMVLEGLIEDAVKAVFTGEDISHLVKRNMACGKSCGNMAGTGCG